MVSFQTLNKDSASVETPPLNPKSQALQQALAATLADTKVSTVEVSPGSVSNDRVSNSTVFNKTVSNKTVSRVPIDRASMPALAPARLSLQSDSFHATDSALIQNRYVEIGSDIESASLDSAQKDAHGALTLPAHSSSTVSSGDGGTIQLGVDTIGQPKVSQKTAEHTLVFSDLKPFEFNGLSFEVNQADVELASEAVLKDISQHLKKFKTNRYDQAALADLSKAIKIPLSSLIDYGGMKFVFESPKYPGKVIKIFHAIDGVKPLKQAMKRELAMGNLLAQLSFPILPLERHDALLSLGVVTQDKLPKISFRMDRVLEKMRDPKMKSAAQAVLSQSNQYEKALLEWQGQNDLRQVQKNAYQDTLWAIDVYQWDNVSFDAHGAYMFDW